AAGEPVGVPGGPGQSDRVRVHAEAHLVVKSGRDLVQHPGAEVAAAVQLCLVRRPQGEDPPVHRILQPDDGQADSVALLAAAESRRRFRAGIGRTYRLATCAVKYYGDEASHHGPTPKPNPIVTPT